MAGTTVLVLAPVVFVVCWFLIALARTRMMVNVTPKSAAMTLGARPAGDELEHPAADRGHVDVIPAQPSDPDAVKKRKSVT